LNLKINKFILAEIILLLGVCWFFAPDTQVFAADELSSGRRLWDNILLFANFGILVFFFVSPQFKDICSNFINLRLDILQFI